MKPQAAPARMPAATATAMGMPRSSSFATIEAEKRQSGGLAQVDDAAADPDERLRDRKHADDRHGEGDREHGLVRQEVGAIERRSR